MREWGWRCYPAIRGYGGGIGTCAISEGIRCTLRLVAADVPIHGTWRIRAVIDFLASPLNSGRDLLEGRRWLSAWARASFPGATTERVAVVRWPRWISRLLSDCR